MSANTGVVTHGGATHEVQQYYDSVIVQLPGTNVTKTTKYCFLSRVDSWDDPNTEPNEENTPPTPSLSQKSINDVFKNMFVIKRVYPQDMQPMIDRIDWTKDFVYAIYRDDIDIIARDSNGYMINKFYVKNRFDQVFKCLWNNKGGASTDEPYFQPGTLNSNGIYTGTDGYKWVFMYTIDAALKQKFLDDNWMPTPLAIPAGLGSNTVNSGNVPVVNAVQSGSNYASNTIVRVIGANTRPAVVTPVIQNGSIVDYLVSDSGEGYTKANVEIISTTGNGAIATANVSPVNGHGSDPFEEFGAQNIMVTNTFSGDEADLIPTDINYRQIGFIINPVSKSGFPNQCQDSIYSTTTDIVVSDGFDFYTSDEIIYQGTDLANATFTATCLSFDPNTNVLRLINTTGTAANGLTIVGVETRTTRTVLNVTTPDYIPYTGYITYIENRAGTQRSPDGSEQVRLVVGFN
jgi:hypothetical protein